MIRRPPRSTLFPYTRSSDLDRTAIKVVAGPRVAVPGRAGISDTPVSKVEIRIVRAGYPDRSEEHTSELQSPCNIVCRLLLEKNIKLGGRRTTHHVGHDYTLR